MAKRHRREAAFSSKTAKEVKVSGIILSFRHFYAHLRTFAHIFMLETGRDGQRRAGTSRDGQDEQGQAETGRDGQDGQGQAETGRDRQ